MTITWTPNTSESPKNIRDLDQVADFSITELQSCQQAVNDARDLIQSALDLREMIRLFEGNPPRFRHDRVAENVAYITRQLSSFADWTGGSLLRLCVFSKQEVARVVCDAGFREALRSRIPVVAVHEGHFAKLKRLKSNTAIFIRRVQIGKSRENGGTWGDEDVKTKRRRIGNEEQHSQLLHNESATSLSQNDPESTQVIRSPETLDEKSPPIFVSNGTEYSGMTGVGQGLLNEEAQGVEFVHSHYWNGSVPFFELPPTTLSE